MKITLESEDMNVLMTLVDLGYLEAKRLYYGQQYNPGNGYLAKFQLYNNASFLRRKLVWQLQ